MRAGLRGLSTWRSCVAGFRICCRRAVRILRCQPTLIQYWWHFRAFSGIEGVPLGQLHSHSHYLAEDLGLLRVAENANRDRGKRVRLENDFLAARAAPRTGVAVASFHEVDRPLVFRVPC